MTDRLAGRTAMQVADRLREIADDIAQDPIWTEQADELRSIAQTLEPQCAHPDGPCTCANGIGCVNVPVEQW